MTIEWLINPHPSNQLVAQGQSPISVGSLEAVLRSHTSQSSGPFCG